MANFLYIMLSIFCLQQSGCKCVTRSRTDRRLTTAELRLDGLNSEISNFRGDITDIWESLHQLNRSSSCNLRYPDSTSHNIKTETSVEEEDKDFKRTIILAFQAEKQAMLTFQRELLENWRNHTDRTSKKINEIDTRSINKRLNSMENQTANINISIKSASVSRAKENADLKLQISDLTGKYENLLAINRNLQDKINSLENCPPDWYTYLNSCYYLSSQTATWFHAQNWCTTNKAQLVEYNDMAELKFVLNMSKTFATWGDNYWTGFWVGAEDTEEEWSTSHTQISDRYKSIQNWLPGQPDHDTEDCMMTLVNNNGKWNDGSCSSHLKFVCEKKLLL